jgi:hypothetical protein
MSALNQSWCWPQKTFDRTRQLAEHGNAPLARLTSDRFPAREPARTRSGKIRLRAGGQRLHARGTSDRRSKRKATADIEAVKSIIDQMTVYAPVPISIGGRANEGRAKPGFLLVAAREWRWLLHNVSHAGAIDERDLYALYASIKDLRWIHDVCKVSQLVLISSSNMRTCDTNRAGTTAVTM